MKLNDSSPSSAWFVALVFQIEFFPSYVDLACPGMPVYGSDLVQSLVVDLTLSLPRCSKINFTQKIGELHALDCVLA